MARATIENSTSMVIFHSDGRVGEQAEGGSAILHMGKPEKSGDHLDGVVQGNIPGDSQLRCPVKEQHQQGNQKVNFARRMNGHSDMSKTFEPQAPSLGMRHGDVTSV